MLNTMETFDRKNLEIVGPTERYLAKYIMNLFTNNAITRFIFWIAIKVIIAQSCMHLVTMIQVNKQLGFSYATPCENNREVFMITQCTPGKTMHEAGLRAGDYVLFKSVDKLYYMLASNQGRKVCIPVQREKQRMDICLYVLALKLTFSTKLIFWIF